MVLDYEDNSSELQNHYLLSDYSNWDLINYLRLIVFQEIFIFSFEGLCISDSCWVNGQKADWLHITFWQICHSSRLYLCYSCPMENPIYTDTSASHWAMVWFMHIQVIHTSKLITTELADMCFIPIMDKYMNYQCASLSKFFNT